MRVSTDGFVEIYAVPGRSSTSGEFADAIREAGSSHLSTKQHRLLDAQFELDSLAVWRNRLSSVVFSIDGVTGLDMDEASNRVGIHVTSPALEGLVQLIAERVYVPTEALLLTVVERGETTQATLHDWVRPFPGGMLVTFTYPDTTLQACSGGVHVKYRRLALSTYCVSLLGTRGGRRGNRAIPTMGRLGAIILGWTGGSGS